MKLVKDLSGRELDHYVALALGAEKGVDSITNHKKTGFFLKYLERDLAPGFALVDPSGIVSQWNPSAHSWIGMKIIEREKIGSWYSCGQWEAAYGDPVRTIEITGPDGKGPTQLVAVCRALVTSAYGEKVPE